MAKCENCYHRKICIDGANHKNTENCKQYINEANIVEPVRHGRWTEKKINGGGIWDYYFVCSECHHETPNRGYTIAPDYCPGCGAKMDGGEFNE